MFLAITFSGCCCCCNSGVLKEDIQDKPQKAGFSKYNPVSVGTPIEFSVSDIKGSSIRITCIDVKKGDNATEFLKTKGYKPVSQDGQHYIVTTFKVEFLNHKSDSPEKFIYRPGNLKCLSPDFMREYYKDYYNFSGTLFKGDTGEGWVAFQVNDTFTEYLMSYNTDFHSQAVISLTPEEWDQYIWFKI